MDADSVLIRKAQIIEKCVQRMKEEWGQVSHLENLSQTQQDSILLNLERACQACIDAAMRVVSLRKLGLPSDSREAFTLMHKSGLLDDALHQSMARMVGFRNTAVHDYQGLNLKIVDTIVQKHLSDFTAFAGRIIKLSQ